MNCDDGQLIITFYHLPFSLKLKKVSPEIKAKQRKLLRVQQNNTMQNSEVKQKKCKALLKKAKVSEDSLRTKATPKAKIDKTNSKSKVDKGKLKANKLGLSQKRKKKLLLADAVAGCSSPQNVITVNMARLTDGIELNDSPPRKTNTGKNVGLTKKTSRQVLWKPLPSSTLPGKQFQKKNKLKSHGETKKKRKMEAGKKVGHEPARSSRMAAVSAKRAMADQITSADLEQKEEKASKTSKKDRGTKGKNVD